MSKEVTAAILTQVYFQNDDERPEVTEGTDEKLVKRIATVYQRMLSLLPPRMA